MNAALLAALVAILAAVATVAQLGLDAPTLPLQAGLLVASGAWLAAWLGAARRARAGERAPSLGWIVLGAVLLRGVVLAGDPRLSDDVHRYAWEGGLAAKGISPYACAPNDPALAGFRERWPKTWAGLNHPEVSAAYPPVTQAACTLVVSVAGGPERALLPLRIFFALCDVLVLVPLLRLARRFGEGAGRDLGAAAAIAWGWSPLVALEFAGSGHFDSLGILLLVSAFALLLPVARSASGPGQEEERAEERAPRPAAERGGLVCLAAAILTKYLPLAAVPFLVRGERWRSRLLLLAAFVALGFLPLALLGDGTRGLTRGLSEYGFRWESGSLVYRFVEPLFAGLGERDEGPTDPRRLARVATVVLWLAVGAWLGWRGRAAARTASAQREQAVRATLAWIGAFLVLSPTLHPWYVAWIVPFLALAPSLAWGALVALAPLLYWPLAGWHAEGRWEEPTWLWAAVALPFFVLLALEALRRRSPRAPS